MKTATCENCNKTKTIDNFSYMTSYEEIYICDNCRESFIAKNKTINTIISHLNNQVIKDNQLKDTTENGDVFNGCNTAIQVYNSIIDYLNDLRLEK